MIGQTQIGLKPFVIRSMALIMAICYLVAPLHKQVASVFHEISHLLEAPEAIAGHPPVQNATHVHSHRDAHHILVSEDHEHGILQFMASFFDASDEHNTKDDPVRPSQKVDKHLASQERILLTPFISLNKQELAGPVSKTKLAFLSLPYRPPRDFS